MREGFSETLITLGRGYGHLGNIAIRPPLSEAEAASLGGVKDIKQIEQRPGENPACTIVICDLKVASAADIEYKAGVIAAVLSEARGEVTILSEVNDWSVAPGASVAHFPVALQE